MNDLGFRDSNADRVAVWYGAYEYLATQPLQGISGTSRRLHDRELPFDRIADELDELAGVLSGEHSHSGNREDDLLLEGSQVLYWLAVLSVQLGLDGDRDLDLAQALSPASSVGSIDESAVSLRTLSKRWRSFASNQASHADTPEGLLGELKTTFVLVAGSVEPTIGDPIRLIERDLAELQSKPYLADYFASALG